MNSGLPPKHLPDKVDKLDQKHLKTLQPFFSIDKQLYDGPLKRGREIKNEKRKERVENGKMFT